MNHAFKSLDETIFFIENIGGTCGVKSPLMFIKNVTAGMFEGYYSTQPFKAAKLLLGGNLTGKSAEEIQQARFHGGSYAKGTKTPVIGNFLESVKKGMGKKIYRKARGIWRFVDATNYSFLPSDLKGYYLFRDTSVASSTGVFGKRKKQKNYNARLEELISKPLTDKEKFLLHKRKFKGQRLRQAILNKQHPDFSNNAFFRRMEFPPEVFVAALKLTLFENFSTTTGSKGILKDFFLNHPNSFITYRFPSLDECTNNIRATFMVNFEEEIRKFVMAREMARINVDSSINTTEEYYQESLATDDGDTSAGLCRMALNRLQASFEKGRLIKGWNNGNSSFSLNEVYQSGVFSIIPSEGGVSDHSRALTQEDLREIRTPEDLTMQRENLIWPYFMQYPITNLGLREKVVKMGIPLHYFTRFTNPSTQAINGRHIGDIKRINKTGVTTSAHPDIAINWNPEKGYYNELYQIKLHWKTRHSAMLWDQFVKSFPSADLAYYPFQVNVYKLSFLNILKNEGRISIYRYNELLRFQSENRSQFIIELVIPTKVNKRLLRLGEVANAAKTTFQTEIRKLLKFAPEDVHLIKKTILEKILDRQLLDEKRLQIIIDNYWDFFDFSLTTESDFIYRFIKYLEFELCSKQKKGWKIRFS